MTSVLQPSGFHRFVPKRFLFKRSQQKSLNLCRQHRQVVLNQKNTKQTFSESHFYSLMLGNGSNNRSPPPTCVGPLLPPTDAHLLLQGRFLLRALNTVQDLTGTTPGPPHQSSNAGSGSAGRPRLGEPRGGTKHASGPVPEGGTVGPSGSGRRSPPRSPLRLFSATFSASLR